MRSASRPPQPRHLPAALASAGLVLMAHGWLLSGLPRAPGPWRAATASPPRAVQVRQIVLPAATKPVTLPVLRSPAPQPPSQRLPQPAPSETAAATVVPPPATPAADASPAATTPVYATRLAPAATLYYGLRRGAASGRAVLRWAPDGGRYDLSLHGQLLAAPSVAWVSQGAIDAHGIAPERYTESRRGRELRAANFQRASARITFSGPQLEYALPPGAQDRLSWMLQLGAVMAADPTHETPGERLLLFVVGSRGDAEVWTFTVQSRETIELPGTGHVDTVHLRREPQRTYDTLVDVWLDPRRHHLPVRARISVRADSTEFVLEQLTLP